MRRVIENMRLVLPLVLAAAVACGSEDDGAPADDGAGTGTEETDGASETGDDVDGTDDQTGGETDDDTDETGDTGTDDGTDTGDGADDDDGTGTDTEPVPWAHVTGVTATGQEGAYTFSVQVHSADTGCEQYCDWWEVLSPEGELLFRRTLAHAHLEDGNSGNPFERAGGPVPVAADQTVIVRGHMNTGGYTGMDMRGSVADGFVAAPDLGPSFAAEVEADDPQPPVCDPNQT